MNIITFIPPEPPEPPASSAAVAVLGYETPYEVVTPTSVEELRAALVLHILELDRVQESSVRRAA